MTYLLGGAGAGSGGHANREELVANGVSTDAKLERSHVSLGVVGAGVVLHGGDVEGNADGHATNEGDEHLEVEVDAKTEVSDLINGGLPDWKGRRGRGGGVRYCGRCER